MAVIDVPHPDPLAGIFQCVRFDGAAFVDAEFNAPWCIGGKYGSATVREGLAGAVHVVFFHFIVEGRCKVRLSDASDALDLAAGDLVLFPKDDRHLMGSHLHIAPSESERMFAVQADCGPVQIRAGRRGAATRVVCGYIACNRIASRLLFDALPRMIRIPLCAGMSPVLLHELLRMGVRETLAARSGREAVLTRLAELLFMQVLRQYVHALPPEGRSWLAGARDPQIGRALALLHREPFRPWSLEDLAREGALSRSLLVGRFTALVGEPPMRYLTRWRLAFAAQELRSSTVAVSRIAQLCGYESEAAFCRAFKREFGETPASWRRAEARRAQVRSLRAA